MIFTSETEILEFKKTTAEMKEAVVSVCAMLNKHGSVIFILELETTEQLLDKQ